MPTKAGGVYRDDVTGWAVAELLRGLLAEGCRVPLPYIVAGSPAGCAFPNPLPRKANRASGRQSPDSRWSASFKTHS